MLNTIITLLLINLPISLVGIDLSWASDYVRKVLLNEQFITPPEESDVGWTGMFHHFGIEKSGDVSMLRLKGNAIRSDTSWLATSVSLYHGEWNYTISISGEPSNSNRIDLVIMSDTVDLKSNFNGYILKAGENGSNDVIRLVRVDNGIMTPILSGNTTIAEGGAFQIRLVRDPIGHWMLYVAKLGEPFELQGSTHDTKYGNLGYTGLRIIHKRTRNMDYAIGPINILQTTPQRNLTSTGLTPNYRVFSGDVASTSVDAGALISPRDILINEYLYYPPEDIPQFVELINVSSNPINLRGWELRDNSSGNRSITPSDMWIQPGAYLVLTPDSSILSSYYSAPNVRQMARFPLLNRGSKDAVILRASSGLTIDSLGYTPSPVGDGVSIERISLQAPSWFPINWKPSSHRRGATPGEPNSIPPEEPIAPKLELAIITGSNSMTLTFSAEINIATISNISINGIRTPFSLCKSTDWKVVYCASATAWPVEPNNPSYIAIESIQSLLGAPLPIQSSPIARIPQHGDLLINEILFNPLQARFDGGSDQSHFVELINTRNYHVFVGDLQLKTKSSTGTSTITFAEKSSPIIIPESMLVLHADTATTATSRLSQFFGLVDDSNYIRANRSTLSLNSTSGTVWIYASNQITIDSIRYDAVYHYPSVRDRRGVSLERISIIGSSVDPKNWGSHAGPLGGSPGLVNSLSIGTQIASESTVRIYPNPFSPDNDSFEDVTSIALTMPDVGWLVNVIVHDRYGRKVRTLADGERIGASHEIFWNGLDDNNRRVFTGFYIVLVEAWHVEQRKSQVYKKVIGLIHQPGAGVSFK